MCHVIVSTTGEDNYLYDKSLVEITYLPNPPLGDGGFATDPKVAPPAGDPGADPNVVDPKLDPSGEAKPPKLPNVAVLPKFGGDPNAGGLPKEGEPPKTGAAPKADEGL